MLVREILKTKGAAVQGISRHLAVGEIIKILADKRIGTVLVTEHENRLAGIISERDIIKYLALRGAGALEMQAEEIMTQRVVTCTSATILENALEQMRNHKIRHLPVVDDGVLVGIISTRDLLAAQKELLKKDSEKWGRVSNAILKDLQFN